MYIILDMSWIHVQNAIHMIARCSEASMHPMDAGPPVSGIASCIPSRLARTTPLDELPGAARTTLRVVCFGLPDRHPDTRHARSRAARFASARAK
jgi:hypothetical protein